MASTLFRLTCLLLTAFRPIDAFLVDTRAASRIHLAPSPSTKQSFALPKPSHIRKAPSRSSLKATAAALVALPGWKVLSAACLLPTCLGYWKTEYGVSYAYGTATAVSAGLVWKSLCDGRLSAPMTLSTWHAASLVFYGTRLCLFLLYRELFVPNMRDLRDRIEERSRERGSRLQRTPFVLGCSALYFGLVSPVLISAQLPTIVPPSIQKALRALIATTWFGYILAALGDLQKSVTKAIKGPDHLVTGGIFQFLRHPNYTGEVLSWTSNFLVGALSAIVVAERVGHVQMAGLLVSSLLGVVGIDFVLAAATNNLEKKQREKYGNSSGFQKWIGSSWPGFMLQTKKEEDSHTDPHLEVYLDEAEEAGSGI